jgi:hypothetical protein
MSGYSKTAGKDSGMVPALREDRESQKTQKQWERSEEVIENKGSHTLMSAKTNPKRTEF